MDQIPRQSRHPQHAESFQAALERARDRRLRRAVLAGSPEGGEASAGVDWVDRVAATDDGVGGVRRQAATDS